MTLFSRINRQPARNSLKLTLANVLGALFTPADRVFVPARAVSRRQVH